MRKQVLATDRVAELNALGKTLAFEVKVMIRSEADETQIRDELLTVFDFQEDHRLPNDFYCEVEDVLSELDIIESCLRSVNKLKETYSYKEWKRAREEVAADDE